MRRWRGDDIKRTQRANASARDEANRLRRALPTVELPCDDDGLPTTFAATQGTTQTNCRQQLKELCDRFGAALAFSDATPAPGGGFACDVSVGNTRVGRGVGPRKVLAKENAAENALRALAGGSR